jgi:DNA-binding transcriptional MerR regulator
VNVEAIRSCQRRGLMVLPDKPINGQRRCPPAVIGRVRFIKRARVLGFTRLEIGNLLELDEAHACTETRELAAPHVLAAQNRNTLRFARTAGSAIGRRRCAASPGTAGDEQSGRHGSRGNERLALTGSSACRCART